MEQQVRLHDRRRTGQTLAEFAITLPILLLLLFGIIEFGRIFQAWVTLQNSARAAARYATTGVYNTDKFKLNLNVYDSSDATWHGDIDSIVPCLKNVPIQDNSTNNPAIAASNAAAKVTNLAQRGTAVTYDSSTPGFNTLDPIHAFQDGPESIYATYYSGDDCDPSDPDDQNRRKDLARILSVYDEARIGAAGLALGQHQLPLPSHGFAASWMAGWTDVPSTWVLHLPPGTHYPDPATVPWYQVWDRPLPGAGVFDRLRYSDQKGYFDVTICSTRTKLQDANDPSHGETDDRFIFPTILSTADDSRAPVCLLQETTNSSPGNSAGQQLINDGWTANPDRPW